MKSSIVPVLAILALLLSVGSMAMVNLGGEENSSEEKIAALENKLSAQMTDMDEQRQQIDRLLSEIETIKPKMTALDEKVSGMTAWTSRTVTVDPDQLRRQIRALLKQAKGRPVGKPMAAAANRPVPDVVLAKVQTLAPGAEVTKVKSKVNGGRTIHKIDLKRPNGKKGKLEVAEDGTVVTMKLDLDQEELPQPVADAAQKLYPGASFDKAKQILVADQQAFGVDFKNGKLKLSAILSAEGTVIERKDELTADQLNPEVQVFLQKSHPNTTVRKAKHLTQDGKDSFEVELRSDAGDKIKLRVDAKGQLLEDPNVKARKKKRWERSLSKPPILISKPWKFI